MVRTSTDIIALAPGIQTEIETGRESTKFNPRDNMRGMEIDWAGYAQTVEAVRRSQWQVSGIARTLVDAADENENQPAPTQRFLERYSQVLDEIAGAIGHFGLPDPAEREAVVGYLRKAIEDLDQLGNEVRTADLQDPLVWPAYGAMLLDARRLIRELEVRSHEAVMPTDSGPFRKPPRRIVGR